MRKYQLKFIKINKIIRFEGKIKFDLKSPDGTIERTRPKKIRFLGGYQE